MNSDPHFFDPPLARRTKPLDGLTLVLGGLGLALVISTLFLELERGPRKVTMTGRLELEGEPLAGATVWVEGQSARAFSNAIGEFTLSPVRSGNATVMVRRGRMKVGLPIRIPAQARWDAGALPCFIWRPLSGDPDERPEREGKIEVVQ